MSLPYRHELLLRVTVVNDGPTGEHGYITTAARLATLIAGLDEHVVGVQALPAEVVYLGKTAIESREKTRQFFLRVDTDARGFYLWRVHSPTGEMVAAAPAGTPTLAGAVAEAKREAKGLGLPSLWFDEC